MHIEQEHVLAREKIYKSHRLAPESEDAQTTIDVVFHIVYANQTEQGGYVPLPRVLDQVKTLNTDYANAGITWKLANVTQIQNERWFNALSENDDGELKDTHHQGGPNTLNVYTVGFNEGPASSLLGYASWPDDVKEKPKRDGIVLLHTTLPNPEAPPTNKYNLGRTLVHEAGHWLGLYHTFQGGCSSSGDEVDDTPPQQSAAYGCPKGRDTCPGGGVDPITNFMDYTDDSCMTGFTKGQIKRMRAHLRTYREARFTIPEKLEDGDDQSQAPISAPPGPATTTAPAPTTVAQPPAQPATEPVVDAVLTQ
jgi:hypothetical protein